MRKTLLGARSITLQKIKLLSLTYATRVFPVELNDKREVDFRTTPLSTDPPDFSDCTDKWSSESDWLHAPITSISSVMKKKINYRKKNRIDEHKL